MIRETRQDGALVARSTEEQVQRASSLPMEVRQGGPNFSRADQAFFRSPRMKFLRQELSEPYRQHGNTYMIIRALSSNIAQVPFLIRTGPRKKPRVVDDGELGSEWLELFETPNPMMNTAIYWEAIVIWLSLEGEVRIIKDSGENRPVRPNEVPKFLWPVNGREFDPVVDKKTKRIVAWVRFMEGEREPQIFQPHELLPILYYNPYEPFRGLAPWEPASMAARQDFKASIYNEAFFDNDATPGVVFMTQRRLSREQRQDLQEAWNDEHQGFRKRRRLAVLHSGLDIKEISSTHREMEFSSLRALTLNEQLGIFKVPKSEVSLHENLNFATSQSADRGFWTKTLIPIMRLIEWGHWQNLMKEPSRGEFWLEFDTSTIEALRVTLEQKLKNAERLQKMGYPLNQVNEAASLGMERQKHGDVILIGGGLKSLEQVLSGQAPDGTGEFTDPSDDLDDANPDTPTEPEDESEPVPTEGPKEKELELVRAFIEKRDLEDEDYWESTTKRYNFEHQFRSKLERVMFEVRCEQLRLLPSGAIVNPNDTVERTLRLFDSVYGRVFDLAAAEFGVSATALESVRFRAVEQVVAVANRVNDQLTQIDPNDEYASDQVKRLFRNAKARAAVVAHLLAQSAANTARVEAMALAGIKKGRWITSNREILRASHRNQNDQIVELGEKFSNGLRFPGDPNGSLDETAACWCVVAPVN